MEAILTITTWISDKIDKVTCLFKGHKCFGHYCYRCGNFINKQ